MNSVYLAILVNHWHCHTETVINAHVIYPELNKPKMEFRFVINLLAIAVASQMLSVAIVTNAKMDTTTLSRVMVAKVVIVIQLEVSIAHAKDLLVNVIVNQELLGM